MQFLRAQRGKGFDLLAQALLAFDNGLFVFLLVGNVLISTDNAHYFVFGIVERHFAHAEPYLSAIGLYLRLQHVQLRHIGFHDFLVGSHIEFGFGFFPNIMVSFADNVFGFFVADGLEEFLVAAQEAGVCIFPEYALWQRINDFLKHILGGLQLLLYFFLVGEVANRKHPNTLFSKADYPSLHIYGDFLAVFVYHQGIVRLVVAQLHVDDGCGFAFGIQIIENILPNQVFVRVACHEAEGIVYIFDIAFFVNHDALGSRVGNGFEAVFAVEEFLLCFFLLGDVFGEKYRADGIAFFVLDRVIKAAEEKLTDNHIFFLLFSRYFYLLFFSLHKVLNIGISTFLKHLRPVALKLLYQLLAFVVEVAEDIHAHLRYLAGFSFHKLYPLRIEGQNIEIGIYGNDFVFGTFQNSRNTRIGKLSFLLDAVLVGNIPYNHGQGDLLAFGIFDTHHVSGGIYRALGTLVNHLDFTFPEAETLDFFHHLLLKISPAVFVEEIFEM